jgi:tRNA(fMet)-specific endonuclease VapC
MLSHLINNRLGVPDRVSQVRNTGASIGTCPSILGEIYYGIEYSLSRDVSLNLLKRGLSGIKIWPFDWEAAKEYGRIAAFLRRTGRLMQIPDVQLAAVAIVLDCTVVTTDSDLLAIPDLRVVDWTKEAESS